MPAAEPAFELSIDPDASQVRVASDWLEQTGRKLDIPAKQITRLDVCLNEVLANVLDHGGASARSAPIGLRLATRHDTGGAEATLTITDAGAPFDPVAVPPKPRPRTLAEAGPGGLGLLILRANADGLSYVHEGDRNRLTIGVRWSREQ